LKKVEVSAPGKLMLFGEHAVVYNRPCIVTTVDQRIRVLIELVFGDEIKIDAPEVGVAGYTKKLGLLGQHKNLPKGVQFLEMSIKNFFEKYTY
jgi:mevalonate kinase